TQFTAPRRPIELAATVTSPDVIVDQGWTLVTSPPGSSPSLVPAPDPTIATLTPDVEGSFLMRFEAVDGAGRSASCEVEVRSIVGPPAAICPEEELVTPAGTPLVVMGDGFDDELVVAFA